MTSKAVQSIGSGLSVTSELWHCNCCDIIKHQLLDFFQPSDEALVHERSIDQYNDVPNAKQHTSAIEAMCTVDQNMQLGWHRLVLL